MPSVLEEVLKQIAELQQMRSAGTISEFEYNDFKEKIIGKALPGNRGPGLAVLDRRLPYDVEDRNDAYWLKPSLLAFAIIALCTAVIAATVYYHGLFHANFTREARREILPLMPKTVTRANAPPPAAARPSEPEGEQTAPFPDNKSKPSTPQPLGTIGAPETQMADGSLPAAIGQCVETTAARVIRRSDDEGGTQMPNSGSAIQYKNGSKQISNEQIGGIDASMPGDRIQLCLVSRPSNCPRGDNRGSVYHALNLRTGADWDAPNSERMCGGT